MHLIKLKILLIILLIFYPKTEFAGTIDLHGIWQIRVGDSLSWANSAVIDTSWEYISVPEVWNLLDFKNFQGYAWYRKEVYLPASWQHDKYLQLKKYLILELGAIDDVDNTYFNGHLIGKTGEFPPEFNSAWNSFRRYQIPVDLVRWGEKNLIMVRVYEKEGNGGIYKGNIQIRTPSPVDFTEISFEFGGKKCLFKAGEPIAVKINLQNNSFDYFYLFLDWQLKSDMGLLIDNFQQKLYVPVGKKKSVSTQLRCNRPGIYQATANLYQNEELIYQHHQTVGYSVERLIQPPTSRGDFNDFWQRTRQQLDLIPAQPVYERLDSLLNLPKRKYNIKFLSFDNVYINGTITIPQKPGKYPAMINVLNFQNDYGTYPDSLFNDWIILYLNVRNLNDHKTVISPGFSRYLIGNINDKERYIARGAIMDCIRGVDIILSHSWVDTTRLAIFGESLTGGFAFIAAALDYRIKALIVNSPLLAAFEVATKFPAPPYHQIVSYVVENPHEKRSVFINLTYFDLINFAPKLRCPVLINLGLQDDMCPPRTTFLLFNQLSTAKEPFIYPEEGHLINHPNSWRNINRWFNQKFIK